MQERYSGDKLGNNVQKIRKQKRMTQKELAEAIGINLQNMSKIERGVSSPAFDNFKKIMEVLNVSPNELMRDTWEPSAHIEQYIMEVLKKEETFNMELEKLADTFQTPEEYQAYAEAKLSEYITCHMDEPQTTVEELQEIKKLIQRQKADRLIRCYTAALAGNVKQSYDDTALIRLAESRIPDVSPEQ